MATDYEQFVIDLAPIAYSGDTGGGGADCAALVAAVL